MRPAGSSSTSPSRRVCSWPPRRTRGLTAAADRVGRRRRDGVSADAVAATHAAIRPVPGVQFGRRHRDDRPRHQAASWPITLDGPNAITWLPPPDHLGHPVTHSASQRGRRPRRSGRRPARPAGSRLAATHGPARPAIDRGVQLGPGRSGGIAAPARRSLSPMGPVRPVPGPARPVPGASSAGTIAQPTAASSWLRCARVGPGALGSTVPSAGRPARLRRPQRQVGLSSVASNDQRDSRCVQPGQYRW